MEFAEADTRVRIKALELDLQRQRAELALYSSDDHALTISSSERENELRLMRSSDPVARSAMVTAKSKTTNGSGNSSNGKKTRKDSVDAA